MKQEKKPFNPPKNKNKKQPAATYKVFETWYDYIDRELEEYKKHLTDEDFDNIKKAKEMLDERMAVVHLPSTGSKDEDIDYNITPEEFLRTNPRIDITVVELACMFDMTPREATRILREYDKIKKRKKVKFFNPKEH